MTFHISMRAHALCALTILGVAALFLSSIAGATAVLGQEAAESTPDLDVPIGDEAGDTDGDGTTQDPVVTPTAVVGSTSGRLQSEAQPEEQTPDAPAGPAEQPADDPGQGIPVLAQGLVYLNGSDVIWQVRQVELGGPSEAPSVGGNARVILQRSGTSIVRNDLTGKRARLEPGEAYFAAADDPYTAIAEGESPSVVWIFEVSNANDVGEGAFYLSPNVSGYAESVYDLELSRFTLQPGGSVDVPQQSGPALIVVITGGVSVTQGDGDTALSTQEGLTVSGPTTLTASEGGQVEFVAVTVGPSVSDETAAAPVQASTPEAPVEDAPAEDVASDAVPADQESGPDAVEPPPVPSGDTSGLDPALDEDADYMTNGDEIAIGLDPFDPDTDGDRLLDGQEASDFGTDPFVLDSDGDGLIDGAEYDTYGTKPAVWDTDGDGWGDGDEVDMGSDPLDPESVP